MESLSILGTLPRPSGEALKAPWGELGLLAGVTASQLGPPSLTIMVQIFVILSRLTAATRVLSQTVLHQREKHRFTGVNVAHLSTTLAITTILLKKKHFSTNDAHHW